MKQIILNLLRALFVLMILSWISNGYSQTYGGGSGTFVPDDPYQIWTFEHLQYLSTHPLDWGKNFIQKADISIPGPNTGDGLSPIGDYTDGPFSGTYDGAGFTITNLYINRPGKNNIGLFGFTTGILKNIGLLNVDITGQDYVGAIGGDLNSTENCYSTGLVNGNSYVGGLWGMNGTGDKCFSSCTVTGVGYIGGLGGQNYGTINNCYSIGDVTGDNNVGGLFGDDQGNIQNCYSTGSVSGTTDVGGLIGSGSGLAVNCFWNVETSGQTNSAGGTPKTTAGMKRVGTYMTDAWDFTLSSNIWGFNGSNNNGYPFLRFMNYTPANIWLGGISSSAPEDWATDENWSEAVHPGSGDKAIIPDQPPSNDPHISTSETVKDLTVEAGGILAIILADPVAGQLTVTGSLITEYDVDVPPLPAGSVIVESSPSLSLDASLVNYSENVNGMVKRIIPSNGKWHFLSCPIEQASMPEICDGDFAPTTGNFISDGTKFGFYFWKENAPITDENWINLKKEDYSVNIVDFGDPPRFVSGKGYLVLYQSDFTGSEYKTFSGTMGVGNINIPVTAGGNTYNLIGNAYPSSIDWDAASGWTRSALEMSPPVTGGYDFWVFNDSPGVGQYGVYRSGTGGTGNNGVTHFIPPSQGFFVKAESPGNVTMTDEVRCHGTQTWLKANENVLRIKVTSKTNPYSDEVVLGFGYDTPDGSEKWFSLYSTAPSLYLPVDENNYSIRYLNDVSANTAIPLSLKPGIDGKYNLTITGAETFMSVILEDLKTGTTQDLKTNPAYTFTSSTSDETTRFMLRFTPLSIDTKPEAQCNIYIYNNILNIDNPGKSVITVYSIMGNKLLEEQTNNEPLYKTPIQLTTGYYMVTLTNGKMVYSQKVFIK
jgi:hypothetical protein